MSNEFLVLDLPELRRRLEAHKATRPADHFGKEMQTWMQTKGRIAFAIELKEAEAAQQPFYITVPPQPIERPVQPLLRLRKAKPSNQEVDSPGNAGAPGAPIPEVPMSNPNRGRHHNPPARIAHLVGRIKAAAEKGEKLYWAQQEIREICAVYHLEVPHEAQKCRPISQAAPVDLPTAEHGSPRSRVPEGQVVDRAGHTSPLEEFGKLPPPPFEGYFWFREMDRRLLDNLSHFRNSEHKSEEWRQIARDLALLETTARAARQIAERHAEVA